MTYPPRFPTNLVDLEAKLRSLPIPPETYDLTGHGYDCAWVIRKIRRGWAVFWQERGSEDGWIEFEDEGEACDYFMRKVRGWPTE